jgi:hypothetical protein
VPAWKPGATWGVGKIAIVNDRSTWQATTGYVSIEDEVTGWGAIEGSEGEERNPDDEILVTRWPYPLRGIVVEDSPEAGFHEFFFAIDVGGTRVLVCRDDKRVRRLGQSG